MHTAPLQASTGFYPHFTLPWIRSTGFGSHPSDSRRFHTAPLIACGLVAFASASSCRVNLATQMHSLARYSKRTTQTRRFVPFYVYKVSGSFYSLSRVLFNVPSRYLYAIGLETYLRLEVSISQLPAPYPGSSTQDTSTACLVIATGLSPCFAARSSALCVSKRGLKGGP